MQLTMRDAFLSQLYSIAKRDRDVMLLTADFGAPNLDKFCADLPDQFINMGVAEQNMISVAAGLALGGKKVYCYAILPFLTMRAYDQIRVDICAMKLNVTLVGVGVGYAYDDAGDTHHAPQDIAIMRVLPNMTIWSPSDSDMAGMLADETYSHSCPQYVRLDRTKHQIIEQPSVSMRDRIGFRQFRLGRDVAIVATGYMVGKSLEVADRLLLKGIEGSVVDVYRLQPINLDVISGYEHIATIEEHYLEGGLGSIIAELIADNGQECKLKRFGLPLAFNERYGGREHLHKLAGLDAESIANGILGWLK